MKLGKLLGAGKSIFGWQESLTYRANKHVYLPKFNPGVSPFNKKSKEVDSSVATAPCTAAVKNMQEDIKPAPAPVAVEPARAQVTWTEKFNPFRATKTAKPATAGPMPNVQDELSLSDVKVMHNDLSDADVEVVPMKSRRQTDVSEPKPTMTSVPMEFLGEPALKA